MNLKIIATFFSVMAVSTAMPVTTSAFGMPDPKNLTVDDCVKMTGKTKKECGEIIDKIKKGEFPKEKPEGMENPTNMPSASLKSDKPNDSSQPLEKAALSNPTNTDKTADSLVKKISELKKKKEAQFTEMESRITKIIDFLDSNNIECSQLRNDFATFKEKTDSVLSAFDSYLEALKNNSAGSDNASVQDARSELNIRTRELTDFYRNTLRSELNELINKLQE